MSSMEPGAPRMERFVGPADAPDRYRLAKALDERGDVHVYLAVGPDGPVTVRRYVGDEETGQVQVRWNRQMGTLNRIHHDEPGAGIVRIKEVFLGAPDHPAGTAKPEGPWVLYAAVSWHDGVLVSRSFDTPVSGGAALAERLRQLQPVVSALGRLNLLDQRHGDVKPSNIVLVEDGGSVLLDPGAIAGVDEPVREATPGYGHGVNGVDLDLYGLAGTVFWVATLQFPPDLEGRLVEQLRAVGLPGSVVVLLQRARNGIAHISPTGPGRTGRSVVSVWFDELLAACADVAESRVAAAADIPTEALTGPAVAPVRNVDAVPAQRSRAVPDSPTTATTDAGPIVGFGPELADERVYRTWRRRVRWGGFVAGLFLGMVGIMAVT